MKNTESTTVPAGYSRTTLVEALRELSWSRHDCLLLDPKGWVSYPMSLTAREDGLAILEYEGLLAATPNESPEEYTEETFDGLAEWVETHAQEWVRGAIDAESEEVEREEAHQAQIDQRPANPNATSERLEALRTILANLKRA